MVNMTKGKFYNLELLTNGQQIVEYLGNETPGIISDYLEALERYAVEQDCTVESISVKRVDGPANPPNDNFCKCKYYHIDFTAWNPDMEKFENEAHYVCFGKEDEYSF